MKKKFLVLVSFALLGSSGVFAAELDGAVVQVDHEARLANAELATGADSSEDGYLRITVDDFGAWGDFGAGEAPDLFNPTGSPGPELIAFTSGFFFFQGSPRGRELLSVSPNWQAVFPPDESLNSVVLVENVVSDSNSDGVNDRAVSQFAVTGPATDLIFDLDQVVVSAGDGVATLTQDYSVTNDSGGSVAFDLVRSFDGDLTWAGDFTNDEVGTAANADGTVSAFMQEATLPGSTRITISSSAADAYYGGKNGLTPENGGPPYGFGTDVQVWDNFGVPGSWRNHIAGVGYDTDGVSGPEPAGCDTGTGCDGFAGISIPVSLDAGESATITVVHTYGGVGVGSDEPELFVNGNCPGEIELEVTDVTPNGAVRVYYSESDGSTTVQMGQCAGLTLSLDDARLATLLTADGNGTASGTFTAGANQCGLLLQAASETSCTSSEVVAVP